MNNPYEVLGVSENATEEQIKAAYRELVKKYHPDKYVDNPLADLAAEKMREVNEAYDYLMKNRNTGGWNQGTYSNQSYSNTNQKYNDPRFGQVRQYIDAGQILQAENLLNQIPVKNAEWIFLSGMISFKKGWYQDAVSKLRQACDMDPGNAEYRRFYNQVASMPGGFRGQAQSSGYGNSNDDMCCRMLECYICGDICCDCW